MSSEAGRSDCGRQGAWSIGHLRRRIQVREGAHVSKRSPVPGLSTKPPAVAVVSGPSSRRDGGHARTRPRRPDVRSRGLPEAAAHHRPEASAGRQHSGRPPTRRATAPRPPPEPKVAGRPPHWLSRSTRSRTCGSWGLVEKGASLNLTSIVGRPSVADDRTPDRRIEVMPSADGRAPFRGRPPRRGCGAAPGGAAP